MRANRNTARSKVTKALQHACNSLEAGLSTDTCVSHSQDHEDVLKQWGKKYAHTPVIYFCLWPLDSTITCEKRTRG